MLRGELRSRLAEDAVEVGAADGAHGLGHAGALVVHLDLALCLALLLALHAVELAAPGLRHDGLLAYVFVVVAAGKRGEARRKSGSGCRRAETTLRHASPET